jgi:hypothetical protein
MIALGYVGKDEGNQAWEVAVRMRYLVAATYLFSALLQFIGLGLIYNLDKKQMDVMTGELQARQALQNANGSGVENAETVSSFEGEESVTEQIANGVEATQDGTVTPTDAKNE